MDFEKDYLEEKEPLDENIEDLNKDEPFDEKELELEPEKEEPEEQSKGGTKSANDPEPVYFEKFDDALVSDGQGGYTNLGEAVYAKDSGGRTEINELRNLVDNTDGVVHYKGTTTTALSNGSTTNPITIDGEEYTAVFGDIVVYDYTEFVFDGTAWSEFGRPFDTTPTSGSANAVTSDGVYKVTPLTRYINSMYGGIQTSVGNMQCFAYGVGCVAAASRTVAFGDNTRANQDNMVAIGKFNSPNSDDVFNIGNGIDNDNRSNIVEVNFTSMNVNGNIQRDGVGIDDYTTTERKIGKWIDGSKLYQRTFEVTGLSKNTWNNSILDTSDIKIVDFTGLIYWLDNQEASDSTPLNYYASGSDNCFTCINAVQTDMRIYPTNTSSDMSIDKAIITIKYTKPSAQVNLMQTTPTEEVSETPTVEEDDMR